jgi:hypothetical protein
LLSLAVPEGAMTVAVAVAVEVASIKQALGCQIPQFLLRLEQVVEAVGTKVLAQQRERIPLQQFHRRPFVPRVDL